MIDSHTHLCDKRFNEDLDDVISAAKAVGVDKFILPGTDDDKHQVIARIVKQYPDVAYASVGLHPTSVNDNAQWLSHLENVENLLKNPPVRYVAIGETGVDLHWSKDFLNEQMRAFRYQVELSIEYDLPLIIHSREAWAQTFEVLEEYVGSIRGVIHSFSGSRLEVERIERLGGNFYYGINGTVTFKNSILPDSLELIPLNRILLETDAPYLSPVPYRGTRNESSYIPLIAQKVAEIKGVTTTEIGDITTKNTVRLFSL